MATTRILVVITAVLQALAIGLFAAFALSGDAWGIARGMALLLSIPFVTLTLPALWLHFRAEHQVFSAALALGSIAATCFLWLRA
jgi:hypothetical protein